MLSRCHGDCGPVLGDVARGLRLDPRGRHVVYHRHDCRRVHAQLPHPERRCSQCAREYVGPWQGCRSSPELTGYDQRPADRVVDHRGRRRRDPGATSRCPRSDRAEIGRGDDEPPRPGLNRPHRNVWISAPPQRKCWPCDLRSGGVRNSDTPTKSSSVAKRPLSVRRPGRTCRSGSRERDEAAGRRVNRGLDRA
jgi:hypothetical protein